MVIKKLYELGLRSEHAYCAAFASIGALFAVWAVSLTKEKAGLDRADRWGNLVYRETARNFGPIMATAAATTIVQVDELVPLGDLDPETVVTPGIFVDRVVALGERAWLRDGAFVGGVDLEGRPVSTSAEEAS